MCILLNIQWIKQKIVSDKKLWEVKRIVNKMGAKNSLFRRKYIRFLNLVQKQD
jgi:hypothetical protein